MPEIEVDWLAAAELTAWNRPRKWVKVVNHQDGVAAVLCTPRTGRNGLNYWTWGYRLACKEIVWRRTRFPLEQEKPRANG